MILLFLGSPRATLAVMLSVPLSALACLLMTNVLGGTINTMILGGLALAFSRLIDNGVVVLENIFRYMELGEPPRLAAEKGGTEVSLAVLAATVHHLHRLPARRRSLRSQQVPLHAARARRRAVDVRLLRLRHDRRPALLRDVHQTATVLRTETPDSQDAEKPKHRFGFQPIVDEIQFPLHPHGELV